MLSRLFATLLSLAFALCLLPCFPATAANPPAPDLWILRADGTQVRTTTLWGEGPFYLHLWAPSCRPCVQEIKQLDALWPALSAQGVRIVAVAQDHDGRVTVPAFARRHGLRHMPLYIDEQLLLWKQTGARGLPSSYLGQQSAPLVLFHEGAFDWQTLLR